VERKAAENASLEEDYDDAPDEFKGVENILFFYIRVTRCKYFKFPVVKISKINLLQRY